MKRYCWFFLVTLILVSWHGTACAGTPSQKKVLVLNSYHKGYKWTDDINKGIASVLATERENTGLRVEYMDTKRISDAPYYDMLKEIYQYKYGRTRFDVILSTDDNAFNFLRQHGEALFPGIPKVFCGVNYFKPGDLDGHSLFTGVNEAVDVRSGIDLILSLHPDAKQIVVVNDTTTTGQKIRGKLMEVVPIYESKVAFTFLEDMDMPDILAELENLSPGTVVFYTLFLRDKSGTFFEFDESIRLVSAAAEVPVYGAWDFSMDYGIVGGMLTSGFYQGEAAAQIARRILQGEDIRHIPVIQKSPNRYMFDYRQLTRFNIRVRDLPQGSKILHRPLSVYGQYKRWIWGAVASIAGLTAIIVLLLINITRRKRVEQELKSAISSLEQTREQLALNAHQAGLAEMSVSILHNIGNAVTSVNARISRMREMKLGRMIQTLERVRDRLRSREEPGGQKDKGIFELFSTTLEVMTQRRRNLMSDLDFMENGMDHIMETISLQQKYAGLRGYETLVDLNDLIRDAGNMLMDTLVKRGIHLTYDLDDLPGLYLDRNRMIQIFINIIKNAYESIEQAPPQSSKQDKAIQDRTKQITVTTRTEKKDTGEFALIEITDTGMGVSPDIKDDIFKFNFSTKGRGTGFGLHDCSTYIKARGGTIDLSSDGPGKGATLRIQLGPVTADSST